MNIMTRVVICNLYFFINHAFTSIVPAIYLLTIEKSTKKKNTITTTRNVYTLRSITCFYVSQCICILVIIDIVSNDFSYRSR